MPIKADAVVRADLHPVVFQCYKSFWVLLTGLGFLLLVRVRSTVGYQFTWWAVASALAWIPSGLSTIYAVPRIGVSLNVLLNSGTTNVSSFLVFWLVFGEKVRLHQLGSFSFYLAPVYLVLVVLGNIGMVYGPQCSRGTGLTARRLAAPLAACRLSPRRLAQDGESVGRSDAAVGTSSLATGRSDGRLAAQGQPMIV